MNGSRHSTHTTGCAPRAGRDSRSSTAASRRFSHRSQRQQPSPRLETPPYVKHPVQGNIADAKFRDPANVNANEGGMEA
jgi:hypothetical protein